MRLADGARRHAVLAGFILALAACGCLAAVSAPVAAAAPTASPLGTLYNWGWNYWGQLGNGSTTDSALPVPVTLPAGVTAVAVSEGSYTSLAVGSDGKVYAWGQNEDGQLGNGSTTDSATPVQVSLPGGVAAIAVSEDGDTSLALGSDDSVYSWGFNADGQLGNGTTTNSSVPVRVSLPVAATAVSEAGATSYALGSDGNIYVWGLNLQGNFGVAGDTADSSVPVQMSLPGGTAAVAVSANDDTTLALGSDGNVYAWGSNSNGQLGNGSSAAYSPTPVQVALPSGVVPVAVSEGFLSSLALGSDGTIYAWGAGGDGQLGDGSTADSSVPVSVALPGGVAATEVSAGLDTSVALGSNGNVYAWGNNLHGQLGDGQIGNPTSSSTPVRVLLPSGTAVTTVSAGYFTSSAIATVATPPVATTTTLATSVAVVGLPVTLMATVSAADGTSPAGSVQFLAGGTDVGALVVVNASGVATTTTTFATAGTVTLSAEFEPATSAYGSSTATQIVGVSGSAGQAAAGTVPVMLTLPPSGALTVTIAPGTVTMTASSSAGTLTAGGALTDVTISDTRNTYPGWSVSGQESAFTGSGTAAGATIPADALGWVPVAVGSLTGGAALGPPIAPGTSSGGLGDTPAVLAQANAGSGFSTNTISASLTLDLPAGTPAGAYTGELTITYLEAGP